MAALVRRISNVQVLGYCRKSIYLQTNLTVNKLLTRSRQFTTGQCMKASFNIQDNEDFTKRVLESQTPVVVDFHADWCGPCKMLAPRLESQIDSYGDKVHLAKVNIDDHTELAMKYGVDAVPCVIGFRGGREITKFVGLRESDVIKSFIDEVIGPNPK